MLLMNIDYQEMLEGVADSIQEGIETTPLKEKIDLMLATKACHNSIQAWKSYLNCNSKPSS